MRIRKLKVFLIGFVITVVSYSQSLCPPAYLDAYFFNEEVFLSWVQTEDYGDILYDECFPVCSLAIEEMEIVNDVDNGTGGWFRYSDSTAIDCGEGMFPCDDGGDDDFSAHAVYTQSDTIPIDSRLISASKDSFKILVRTKMGPKWAPDFSPNGPQMGSRMDCKMDPGWTLKMDPELIPKWIQNGSQN